MTSFVAQVDPSLADKLRTDLESQGFVLTIPPYTLLSAQKKGISCTLYTSGKLVVQGKDKDDFIAFYLEPEILQKLSYTHPEIEADLRPRIGGDEAGKGDFFGPLCIAAVYADEAGIKTLFSLGVRDSKKLSDETVLKLSGKIRSQLPHSIVRMFPKRYNELYPKFRNLNHLLAWGHATAIAELAGKTAASFAIVDQFTEEPLVARALKRQNVTLELIQRTKAEDDPVVAAASILARGAFLDGLRALSDEVGFELPKGASEIVKTAARKFASSRGKEALSQVAKIHFKTFDEL
jgi:ribonuclease HIII